MKRRLSAFLLAALVAGPALRAQNASEDMAQKIFLSGQNLLRDRNYQQAVQDFSTVVSSYPTSAYADNALLELGKYFYVVEHSNDKALAYFEQIIAKYQGQDTTADAYYYKGQLICGAATTELQLQDGLANFMRTAQFYPNDPIVPESLYQAGLVEFRLQHFDASCEYLERCVTDYPLTPTAPAAQLALGRSCFFLGKTERAMIEIQRVRDLFPSQPESAVALRWLSLIWRLYYQNRLDAAVMFRNQAAQTVRGAAPLQECAGLAFDSAQTLWVSDPKGARVNLVSPDMRVTGGYAGHKPGGIYIDESGAAFIADSTGLLTKERFVPLSWTKPSKKEAEPLEKAREVARTSFGDTYVLEAGDGRVLHFSGSFQFDSVFPPSADGDVQSITVDSRDRLALLLRKERKVTVYDRRGKLVLTLASQGPGYAFQEPTQVRTDFFGHFYVLDRDLHSVLVFDADGKLLTQCASPALRSPRELAVSGSGEIWLWDDKTSSLWVLR